MIHACPLRNYSFKNVFYRNIFYFISPTPSFTPQTMLDACIQNFFRVSILYRVGGGGGGRTARKFWYDALFMREPRNDRKIWILQYCPKDFAQDCLNPDFWEKKSVFFIFPALLLYCFFPKWNKKYAVIHFFAIVLPKWKNTNLKHCVNMHD